MKKILFAFGLFILISGFIWPVQAKADEYVNGYFRSNGTYVEPYWRSDPDGDPYNNYSFPGNYNPYTGVVASGNPATYLNNYYSRSDDYSYDDYSYTTDTGNYGDSSYDSDYGSYDTDY